MVLTGNRDNMCRKLTSDSASIASSAALNKQKNKHYKKKNIWAILRYRMRVMLMKNHLFSDFPGSLTETIKLL